MSPRSSNNGSKKTQKAPAEKRRVTLVVPRLEASDVVATGDFSHWSPVDGVRLKKRRDGCWTAALSVTPGEHQYRLLVDGQWRNNPGAERRVANGFGSENDVIVVD
jgi:1,4-alpha-glucan branching enzyme